MLCLRVGAALGFADTLPENGVPARFTVHLVDVPDAAAAYEFYSVGLLQRALHPDAPAFQGR